MREHSGGGGRSPHARGRLEGLPRRDGGIGSIPACAGETILCLAAVSVVQVDPRMRGGDDVASPDPTAGAGRSPHARGRRCCFPRPNSRSGSIPACAGETNRVVFAVRPSQVDPRMRGGDGTSGTRYHTVSGRSPHARGRHAKRRRNTRLSRSIPACAGETSLSRLLSA